MLGVPVSPTKGKNKESRKMRTKSRAGVLIGLFLLAGAARASAQKVTPAEKDKALQYLGNTKKNWLEATKRLSEAQGDFKAAPGRLAGAQGMEDTRASKG